MLAGACERLKVEVYEGEFVVPSRTDDEDHISQIVLIVDAGDLVGFVRSSTK